VRRVLLIAIVAGLALVSVGGGSSAGKAGLAGAEPEPGTLEALWRDGEISIGATPSTSDHGRGRNRISFLLVDKQSRLVEAPLADIWVSTGLKARPYARAVARLESIGVPGGDAADVQHLYVTSLNLPKAGIYWYLAIPRGTKVHAVGNVIVRKEAEAPEVGERAIPSATPTIRSTRGDLARLTTSRHPNRALYASSVKEALTAKVPFVVTFATPQFCQTRLCGPVVDVVGAMQKQFAKTKTSTRTRFIHAEVYVDNDPAKGVNRWLKEWNLPTEPWTFVVNAKGLVVARFENAMSIAELAAAVRKVAV
jgi:hypothetical protein